VPVPNRECGHDQRLLPGIWITRRKVGRRRRADFQRWLRRSRTYKARTTGRSWRGDTGDIVRQFSSAGPITGSRIVGTGLCAVTFSKDVSGCSFGATLGSVGTNAPTIGMIGVTADSGNPNSIVVQTADKTGTLADASFHLYVSCPK